MNNQTKFVIDKIKETNSKSVLNIGYRYDSDTTIQKFCENNNIEWSVLEIWKENCDFLIRNKVCFNIYNEDVRNIDKINKNFDAIIWLHGPEHVEWNHFLSFRKNIENHADKIIIYQAPEGLYPQEAIYNNIYEKHVQTLNEKMFSELNYKTNNFCKFGEATFSAWIEK